jgi:hypothetical protein
VTPGLIQGQRHAKGKTVLPPSSLVECDSRANDSNALVRVTETTAHHETEFVAFVTTPFADYLSLFVYSEFAGCTNVSESALEGIFASRRPVYGVV